MKTIKVEVQDDDVLQCYFREMISAGADHSHVETALRLSECPRQLQGKPSTTKKIQELNSIIDDWVSTGRIQATLNVELSKWYVVACQSGCTFKDSKDEEDKPAIAAANQEPGDEDQDGDTQMDESIRPRRLN